MVGVHLLQQWVHNNGWEGSYCGKNTRCAEQLSCSQTFSREILRPILLIVCKIAWTFLQTQEWDSKEMTNNLSTDRPLVENPWLKFWGVLHLLQQNSLSWLFLQLSNCIVGGCNNPSLLLYRQMTAFPGKCQIFVLKIKCIIFLCQANLLFKFKMVFPLWPYFWGVLNMADVKSSGT